MEGLFTISEDCDLPDPEKTHQSFHVTDYDRAH